MRFSSVRRIARPASTFPTVRDISIVGGGDWVRGVELIGAVGGAVIGDVWLFGVLLRGVSRVWLVGWTTTSCVITRNPGLYLFFPQTRGEMRRREGVCFEGKWVNGLYILSGLRL